MTMRSRTVLCFGLLALLCGCDRGPSLSEIEERERNSRLYTNAMDDLQAGRMDAAVKGFERVVQQEPKSYSAHFQLATLLQDVRKDYIGAIAHYRDYLALRPASDKATVAQDRMKLCETLLQAEVLRKAGGSASNKFAADNEKLTRERDALAARAKALEASLAKAKREIARLEGENASKHRLLAKLGEAAEEGGAARNDAVKKALAELKLENENVRRRHLNPSDAELLDEDEERPADLRAARRTLGGADGAGAGGTLDAKALAEARALGADADASQRPPTAGTPGKGRPASLDALLGGRAKSKQAAGGARPETYVVQEGDTLYKISMRFYGSRNMWRAIQGANRTTVPMDGRLRVGQTIKLP